MTEILIKSLKNLLLIDLLRKQNVSEDTRRLVMINTICIFAIIVLSIISPLSILRDNIVVGTLDMVSAVLLIFCIWYLRHSGRLRLPINIGIGVMTLLYLYMFFSGGDSHTGHLWYYTYPLLTLYIMDKKDGLVANAVLLLPAFAYLIWIWPRPDAMYTQAFTIRFIPSIICVFIFTYLFESTRLKTQSRLTSKQVELERTITALRTKELELKAAQDNLERRIRERTAELQASNISLKNQIEERKRAENSRKKLEQQLSRAQKMEALGNLAGGVAHDLNNILSGISSYPELLLLSLSEDNAMYRPLKTIQSSGEKAAAIVQDLLTLSRRGVAVFDTVDLCQVLKEYLSSPEFRKMLSFHHGVIYQTRMPDHPCYIRGSNVHLSKSIMNLITNAAEAMPDGGCIDITIEKIMIDNAQHSLPTLGNGPHYKLTISDEGQGIASEALEHLFEPFFTTKKMGRSGTDLGMTVVWGTVQDHHGHIEVQSYPGKGAQFDLIFPAIDTVMLQPDTRALPRRMPQGDGQLILVVDDLPEQCEIAASILERLGYSVSIAASGELAVAWLKKHDADIILLDMMMEPGMNGLETLRSIRSFKPDQRIVIASGYTETDLIREAISLGACGYIKKPYAVGSIAQIIAETLKGEQAAGTQGESSLVG